MKPVYSFRLDKDLIEKAREQGLDLALFIETLLRRELKENKCLLCGRPKKGKQK